MCGINGIFRYRGGAESADRRELAATRDHMSRRGPDGFGDYWSPDGRVGLGHRRLAILDLSERGKQPMASADGSAIVSFNGEIYNFHELRHELEQDGARFASDTDTEVLLHLYRRHGRAMVDRLRGMFAFAIWDAEAQGLFLARDPYGIKPLYTSDVDGVFRFASQVKALIAGGAIARAPDPAGVVGFFLWGSVPEPFTLYRDIAMLPAGCTQWIDHKGAQAPRPYFRIAQMLAEAPAPSEDAATAIRDGVAESTAAHLVADVEVGVFLSAGVDSSALLGLMRDAGQSRIRAVTLAFDEFTGTAQDEAPLAARMAERYDAAHIVRRVRREEFDTLLPRILESMDQPSIDGINTWLVSMAAAEAGLKVALSGVGADEMMAGYQSFSRIPRWVGLMRVPGAVPYLGVMARRMLSLAGKRLGSPKMAGMLEYGGTYAGAYLLNRGLFMPFELKGLLDDDFIAAGLARLSPVRRLRDEALQPMPTSPIARVASLESCQYMRNQLLRDTDWAGMAHSLEIRTPFVDSKLLRRVAPVMATIEARIGKEALGAAPTLPLPDAVTKRPKTGFMVPTERWLASAGDGDGGKGLASRSWLVKVLDDALPQLRGPHTPAPLSAQASAGHG